MGRGGGEAARFAPGAFTGAVGGEGSSFCAGYPVSAERNDCHSELARGDGEGDSANFDTGGRDGSGGVQRFWENEVGGGHEHGAGFYFGGFGEWSGGLCPTNRYGDHERFAPFAAWIDFAGGDRTGERGGEAGSGAAVKGFGRGEVRGYSAKRRSYSKKGEGGG